MTQPAIKFRGQELAVPPSDRLSMRGVTWDDQPQPHFMIYGPSGIQWVLVKSILNGGYGSIPLMDLLNAARCAWRDAATDPECQTIGEFILYEDAWIALARSLAAEKEKERKP